MVPTDPQADECRRRATELRRLAARLDDVDTTHLRAVESWAGPDTWISPGADDCRATLSTDRQRIAHAVEELREGAWRLEHQAEALDTAAALRLAAGVR